MSPCFPHRYLSKLVCEKTRALKFSAGKCWHFGCRNPARKGRKDCETCSSRKKRLANPARYLFANVRSSARKRGIGFQLTFPEFLSFCARTNYLERVGKENDSLSIDRIYTDRPYTANNIRALTYWENVSHSVEGMKDPREPIAAALAKASGKDPKKFGPFMKDAAFILSQVETLQRLEREQEETEAKNHDPKNPF